MITLGFSRTSDEGKYSLYNEWLKSVDPSLDHLNFYGMDIPQALDRLERCSGLVLTGGPDVHPSYYGKPEEAKRCELGLYRDKSEFALIEKALKLKLPILAVCRGEQILNVSQGGDLIVDIPADHGKSIIHSSDTVQLAYHSVYIDANSILYNLTGVNTFDIVSVHHQAVRNLAPCFRPTAWAADGIIEAFEWLNPEGKGYLNAVQWHPEKGDYYNSLSQAIAKDFIESSLKF